MENLLNNSGQTRREEDWLLKNILSCRRNGLTIEETAQSVGITIDDILMILGKYSE